MNTLKPVVVGLDTALGSNTSSGTGIASSLGWCEAVGHTDKKHPLTTMPHLQRIAALEQLADRIVLTVGQPDLVVMESPSLRSLGGGGHERAFLWWEMYRHLIRREIPVALMSPSQRMTYATGKGQASKSQVVDAVARRWQAWETGGDDNLADAVVLMAAGRDWLGHAIAPMPQTHRRALEKTVWPELALRSAA